MQECKDNTGEVFGTIAGLAHAEVSLPYKHVLPGIVLDEVLLEFKKFEKLSKATNAELRGLLHLLGHSYSNLDKADMVELLLPYWNMANG